MRDHRLVQSALFLVFVAVTLIYAVLLEVRGESVRADVVTIARHYGLVPVDLTGAISQSTWLQISSGDDMQEIGEGNTAVVIPSRTKSDTGAIIDTTDEFVRDVIWSTTSWIALSGADLYYGSLDVFKTLGIRYEYIFKDSLYDIFYVYIGKDKTYDLKELITSLWGKSVEIYARNDIVNNLYFWDRVTFMTLPGTPPTVTNLFVRIGSDLRLIQDTSGDYKKHKRHIRQVFTGT